MNENSKRENEVFLTAEVKERAFDFLRNMNMTFKDFIAQCEEKYAEDKGKYACCPINIVKYFSPNSVDANKCCKLRRLTPIGISRYFNLSFKYLFFGIGDMSQEVEDFGDLKDIRDLDYNTFFTEEELEIVDSVIEKAKADRDKYKEVNSDSSTKKSKRGRKKNSKVSKNVTPVQEEETFYEDNCSQEDFLQEDFSDDINLINDDITENEIITMENSSDEIVSEEEMAINENKSQIVENFNEIAEIEERDKKREERNITTDKLNEYRLAEILKKAEDKEKSKVFTAEEKEIAKLLFKKFAEKWNLLTFDGMIYLTDFLNQIDDKFKIG